jgi:hypothetical protein
MARSKNYCTGLVLPCERKSVAPMATRLCEVETGRKAVLPFSLVLRPPLSVLRTAPKSRHWGMAWSPKSAARRPTLPRPQAHVSVLKVKVTGAVLVGRVREKPEPGTGIGPPDRPLEVPGSYWKQESCGRIHLRWGNQTQMEDAGGHVGRARRGRIEWKAEEPIILWKPQSNPK